MGANGWRIMWLLLTFDFPVKTARQKKGYSIFRNILLEENFIQLQYSVYMRHFPSIETARSKAKSIGEQTPDNGKTSIFLITDKQYGMTMNYYGKFKDESQQIEKPTQFLLFSDE